QQKYRHQDAWFCVYNWVEGLNYRELLQLRGQQGRSFCEEETIALLRQMLPVLTYLHQSGATHGNLAPEKIVLRQSDNLPVSIDFGGFTRVAAALEGSRFYAGRPGYAPPEQVRAGVVLPQSDLYALGAVAIALLLGRDPQFSLESPAPQGWSWEQIRVSTAFREILQQMLAEKPGDRFASATAVLEALSSVPSPSLSATATVALSPPAATTEKTPWSRMRSLAIALGKVGFVLLLSLSSGTMGWWAGQIWLDRSLRSQAQEEPDAWPEPEALSFLPADDPEPEPPASLPLEERKRKLALRDRRLRAGIDYHFFLELTNEFFGERYPSQRGRRPSLTRDDAWKRDRWDAIASELLDRLAFLSLPARQQLGRYDPQGRERAALAAERLDVSRRAFFDLVEAQFLARFPEGAERELGENAIAQIEQAIVFDGIQALTSGSSLSQISLDVNPSNRQLEGTLQPWEGKVFLVRLEGGQHLNLSLDAPLSTFFGVYSPGGDLLLEYAQQRSWSDRVPETGIYQLILVSAMPISLNYQLSVMSSSVEDLRFEGS
ncbi:MAG: hypothetical protein SVX43_22235, partial [Cyanobacteriota bacterium]|nr:hypothetical protein [Cyanobacteriota bacterium]